MMALISTGLNQRSVLALVACDLSYIAKARLVNEQTPLLTLQDSNPEVNLFPVSLATEAGISNREVELGSKREIALGDWVLRENFYDTSTGFSTLFFYSIERNEYIVALTGTNGPDGQDWYNNLNFSATQWKTENQEQVREIIDQLKANNPQFSSARITFTGQSLGGALAQFAAYDFVEENPEFSQSQISLITFNGLGAYGGMRALRGNFNTELLTGAETAHYVVYNDIVSRLGEGNFNAPGNTFLLDFRVLPGQERALHFVDAHRIESGFYRGFEWGAISAVARDLGWAGFSTAARAHEIDYLNVSESQRIAAAFGQLFNDEDHSEAESWARLVAGVVHGLRLVPQAELEQITFEFIGHLRRASAQPDALHWTVASATIPAVLKKIALTSASSVASAFSLVLGVAWDVGEDLAGDLSTMREKLARLLPAESYDLDLAHSIVTEPDFAHTMFKTLFGLKVIEGGFLKGLNLGYDANQILGTSFFGTDWLMPGLRHFVEIGRDAGMSVAKVAVTLSKEVVALTKSMGASGSQLVDEVVSGVSNFVLDVGKAIANAHQDFVTKIADTVFDLQRTLGFAEGRTLLQELEEQLSAQTDRDLQDAFEEAVDTVESAGQTIVIVQGGPQNPFDDPAFDPDVAPLPQQQVQEGGIRRFTLSLPYGATEGGQQIAITLDGAATQSTRLLAHGDEVLPENGVYTVTVASGERELELSLLGTLGITQPGLTESGALSLSATLVDSAGQATHQTHVEANVDFASREDLVPDEPFASALTAGNDTVLISTPLAGAHLDGLGGNDVMWGDTGVDRFLGGAGDDRLYGSFRLYFGANDRDWLSGGAGNDQLLGHEGDDLLEGDSGRDAVLGDVGNDVLFAGSQADYATIFTLGGEDASGDLVQGGAGDDLVVGSAGADALSGGNGADLIFGGGGNDQVRGDTEFVPTHTFHIIGTTFPPEQPFAGGADVLYGNAGNDILLGEAGDDRLYGGEGFDNLTGGAGQDELYGGAGDDFLVGDADSLDPAEHADDYLHGGEGSDVLLGNGGNDTLVGDSGDDFLEGGDGNDTYVFNRGDGVDTIFDFDSNTVRFGPGIDASDLKLGLGSLFIHVGEDGDAIRIVNFDPDDVLGSFGVDLFEFLNGEQLTYAQLVSPGFDLEGTEENDFIKGTNLTDRITGGEGNDVLDGASGADVLRGGRGDDIYRVDEPNDVIEEAFDEGHDHVQSTAVSYVLSPNLETLELIEQRTGGNGESEEGGGGQVVITGGIAGTGNDLDNDIGGNSLNNVLDGGGGSDRLTGESGSDTYLFGRGSGADTIAEFVEAPGDVDAIQLGSDIVPAEVAVLREENDLILAIRNSPDRVRIQDWFASDVAKIELALFEDGTAWDSAMLEGMATTGGDNSAPVLVIGIADQIALEDAGFTFVVPADTFVDADTGDALAFSATLEGGAPLPGWLGFGASTRTFSGTPANEDVGAFDITVTATDGGGLSAADVFRVTVENTNDPPVLAIEIANQSTLEDAPFSFALSPDTFMDVDAGDVLTLSAALAGDAPLPAWLIFNPDARTFSGIPLNGDVGVISLAVTATDNAGATAAAHFNLAVENVNDPPALAQPLLDQSGNQNAPLSLQIPEGAFLDVDAGDALLFTATLVDGSPLPTWLEFDGEARVFSGIPSEFDIGDLDIRVTATDSAGASASDDFALSISDASAVNETHSGTRHRDAIVTGFANDLIDADRGDDVVRAGAGRDGVYGGKGHDQLSGEAGNDLLDGGEGHDHLLGGLGEDVLAGGKGHDSLEGGEGHDAYLHERHGGHDTIEEQGSGLDALLLGEGITPEMARLERRRDDLVVDLRGDHGSVTIRGWFASDSKKVETIQFADGTAWGIDTILEQVSRKGHHDGGHHDDDPGHHHHHSDEDGDRHGKSAGRTNDGGGRGRTADQRDPVAAFLAAHLADEVQYDFEVPAIDAERSAWQGEVLSPQEIARRWHRIARYGASLSDEQDDDASKGAAYRFDGRGLLDGALGGGFGYAGSTGAARSAANMRTLEGLKEGFLQLHD